MTKPEIARMDLFETRRYHRFTGLGVLCLVPAAMFVPPFVGFLYVYGWAGVTWFTLTLIAALLFVATMYFLRAADIKRKVYARTWPAEAEVETTGVIRTDEEGPLLRSTGPGYFRSDGTRVRHYAGPRDTGDGTRRILPPGDTAGIFRPVEVPAGSWAALLDDAKAEAARLDAGEPDRVSRDPVTGLEWSPDDFDDQKAEA